MWGGLNQISINIVEQLSSIKECTKNMFDVHSTSPSFEFCELYYRKCVYAYDEISDMITNITSDENDLEI